MVYFLVKSCALGYFPWQQKRRLRLKKNAKFEDGEKMWPPCLPCVGAAVLAFVHRCRLCLFILRDKNFLYFFDFGSWKITFSHSRFVAFSPDFSFHDFSPYFSHSFFPHRLKINYYFFFKWEITEKKYFFS